MGEAVFCFSAIGRGELERRRKDESMEEDEREKVG